MVLKLFELWPPQKDLIGVCWTPPTPHSPLQPLRKTIAHRHNNTFSVNSQRVCFKPKLLINTAESQSDIS